jgi:hypothetical protein
MTTAEAAVSILRTYDKDYAAGTNSIVPGQCFSNVVLGEYYKLCKEAGLIPATGPQSKDPIWAEHYFHKFPGYRCIAVANIVDRIAKAYFSEIAALTAKISKLEASLKEANTSLANALATFRTLETQLAQESEVKSEKIEIIYAALVQERDKSAALERRVAMANRWIAQHCPQDAPSAPEPNHNEFVVVEPHAISSIPLDSSGSGKSSYSSSEGRR